MDRNQAKELLPIIKAFGEGKDIEIRSKNPHAQLNGWAKMDEFIFGNFEYRIKPEPAYRPFANAEECWNEMQKHQPFGWVKGRNDSRFVIENVDSRGFVEVYDEGTCNFNEVFEFCTFVDGTPFGIIDKE
jgi:hypothetical protein